MSQRTRNPYPRQPGFAGRVRCAKSALQRFGADYDAAPYNRRFDTCFEMLDGEAVVWALMQAALTGDVHLERGIRNMGAAVWPQWLTVYEVRRVPPTQGDFFG